MSFGGRPPRRRLEQTFEPRLVSHYNKISVEHFNDHEVLQRKANYWHDVMDYGAAGDGVSDDTAAVQEACDAAAAAGGTLFFPPRPFAISDTVAIGNCHVEATGAELLVAGSAPVGLRVGGGSVSCDFKSLRLPSVKSRVRDWAPTGMGERRGIVFAGADGCLVDIATIGLFSYGLVLEGDSQGVAYNTFRLSYLSSNAVNLYVGSINGGWSNQNTFLGGRFNQYAFGLPTPFPGFTQVKIAQFSNNNNTFIGCSLEGNVAEWMIDSAGTTSMWQMCRFETSRGQVPQVRWRRTAAQNIIQGGSYVDVVSVTDESTAGTNAVLKPTASGWAVNGV